MKIDTARFGAIKVNESEWIIMKGPILGFERFNRFVLLLHDKNTPLMWLQSVDDPALAFVVVNPLAVKADYSPVLLDEHLDFLKIKTAEHIVLLSIVTVRNQPFCATANLKAPILINANNRMAKQIILEDHDFPIQYDLLDQMPVLRIASSTEPAGMSKLDKLSFTLGGETA